MEVISRSSTLNPNAPLFVPLAYRAVEDYSDDWWALIQSSTWFRDYWLRECFQDPQNIPNFSEFDDVMLHDDVDSLFHDSIITRNSEEEKEMEMEKEGKSKEIVTLGSLKWTKRRGCASAMNKEKAPKIVNVKVGPRPIQQPR